MTVTVERTMPEITVMVRMAHLARIIPHGMILVLPASQIIGGETTVNSNADAASRNYREDYYSTCMESAGGDPLQTNIERIEISA
jgi:hypothetical protein